MAKPEPGTLYTVVTGDNLSKIAAAAYGDGTRWREIWKANKRTLFSGKNPDYATPGGLTGADYIRPGETIFIPGNVPKDEIERLFDPNPTIPGKKKGELTILIDGNEIKAMSATVTRLFDSAADGWAAEVAWLPGQRVPNSEITYDELFIPFGYKTAEIYLGGELQVKGLLYRVSREVSADKITGTLEGWSLTADAIDSNMNSPFEQKMVTLEQRAKGILEPLGIGLAFNLPEDEPFKKVAASPSDTIFDHINSLAQQRGAVVTNTTRGEILITRAGADLLPVGTLFEGAPPLLTLSADYDGRSRFNTYTVTAQIQRKKSKKRSLAAVAKDKQVPRSRTMNMESPEATPNSIQQAADWERSKRVANSMVLRAQLSSWYTDNLEEVLWQPGDIVVVISPSVFVPKGYSFMVRSVEFQYGIDGATSTLELVPPQVFTGETVDEPWSAAEPEEWSMEEFNAPSKLSEDYEVEL